MAGIDAECVFTGSTQTIGGVSVGVPGPQELCQTASNTDSYFEINLNEGLDAFGDILTNPDPGMGKPVFVNIVITAAPTGAGGATTVLWNLQSAIDTGGTGTNQTGASGTYYTIATTGTIPYADLVVGWKISILIPPGMSREAIGTMGLAQFLKLNQVTGVSTLTGGYYYAWLSGEPVSTS